MNRCRTILYVGLIVAALTVAGCGGTDETATDTETSAETASVDIGTVLAASVGPGFEISLSTDSGPLTSLATGTYTIEVDDQSSEHNFHLSGPGVDEKTGVAETGTTTWEVTFTQEGTYTFVCDPHASSMKGSFEVSGP